MPKSWEKRYQWILQQKTSLDDKYEKLRAKVNEVEKKTRKEEYKN